MIKNATLISISKLAEKSCSFLTVILLTYIFTPEDMGKFFFYFSLLSLLLPFMDFGLKKLFVLEANKLSDSQKKTLFGTLITLKVSCGLSAWLLALSIEAIIHYSNPAFLAISLCFLAIFFEELAQLFRCQDHANEKYLVEILAPLVNKVGCLVAIYFFQVKLEIIENALSFYAFFCLIGAIFSILSFRGTIPYFSFKHIKSHGFTLLKNGFPYSVTGLCVMLSFYVDSVILGYFSFAETGTYNAAFRIVIVFGFLSSGISHIIFTKFSKSNHDCTQILNQNLPFIITIFTSVAIGTAALSKTGIQLIYDDSYQQAADILTILAPFILLSALSNIFAHSLEAKGRQKEVMKFNSWTCGFNLIANLLLIPIAGMYAAAVTTVFTEMLNTYFSYRYLKKEHADLRFCESRFAYIFIFLMIITGFAASKLSFIWGALLEASIFLPLLYIQYNTITIRKEKLKCVY